MNKGFIVGNLTRDPETRATPSGKTVCNFTVAVNRRRTANGQQEVDYFRVSAWGKTGENCQRFLSKGRKVNVVGPVSCSAYMSRDGKACAQLEITADDVEFLSARGEPQEEAYHQQERGAIQGEMDGYIPVQTDELPF